MRPRRAQERHTHEELQSGSGAGDPTRRIYRAWHGAGAPTSILMPATVTTSGTTGAPASGGTVLASRMGWQRSFANGQGFVYTDPWLAAVRGFIVRAQFGFTAGSGSLTGFAGVSETTDEAQQSVGLAWTAVGSPFQWWQSGSGSGSAMSLAINTLYDVVLHCDPGGPVVGYLTDMETLETDWHEFSSVPLDVLLRVNVRSFGAHTVRVCRLDATEFL